MSETPKDSVEMIQCLKDGKTRAECETMLSKKQTPATQPDGFMQKMIAVFQEAMAQELVKFRAELKTSIDKIVAEQQDEAVKALKDGLGLSKDQTIHMSELPGMVRKILLDSQPSGKRTETTTPDVPIEGNDLTKTKPQTDSPEKMFEAATKQRSVF